MKEKKNTEKKYWLKPEEDFGRIGVVIGKEREMAGFSSRGVSDRLCSESSLRRLEQGKMGCEKVLADALLERMGVSPSRMLFYLSLKEEEYLQSRENWIQEIRQGHWQAAEEYQNQYQKQTEIYHKLHQQFSLLMSTAGAWERYCREAGQKDNRQEEWLKRLEEADRKSVV